MAEAEEIRVPFGVKDEVLVGNYGQLPEKCQRCPGVLEMMGGLQVLEKCWMLG